MSKSGTFKVTSLFLMAVFAIGGSIAGCDLIGGGLLPFPPGEIATVQLEDEPDYTVAFGVDSAAIKASDVAKVNWVFGDGEGFVEGAAGSTSITHRYLATGTFEVTAFLFDDNGFVVQVDGTAVVSETGTPNPPQPPENAPEQISFANPADGAEGVSTDITLTWIEGENATSHDVYLGTVEADVENATRDDGAIFHGNQTETEYDLGEATGGLTPDTEYFWRIDEVNDDATTKGEVMSFTTAPMPGQIEDPVPADGVTTAPVDQVLSWTPGDDATSHDVFFGKVLNDVINATNEDDDVFQGNQTGSTFDPEDEDADITGQLLANTTYYWRIDEVGPGGTTKGDTLQFKTATAPDQITNPNPADLSVDVDIRQNLNWTAAPNIDSFDLYFGIDRVAVENAKRTSPEFKGNQTSKTFDPGDMLGSTQYYWRVDTLGDGGTTTGLVLAFATADPPAQVAGPFDPINNATNVDVEAKLTWNVGVGGTTTSFDVYFSTDENAVTNGLSTALQGNQGVATTIFDPGSMIADTIYYWRIDAVGPGGITAGPTLTFRTGALPEAAYGPDPANNAKGVALDVTLGWDAGVGAETHKVYFGKNRTDVDNADVFDAAYQGEQIGTTFAPVDELEGNTDYYWRIDESTPGGDTKGPIWTFTTAPGQAENPVPLNNETGVALDVTLEWDAGDGAVAHEVYFGDNLIAVGAATTASPEYEGQQGGTTYAPDSLVGDATYYWRVDEVGDDGTTKGEVWAFTTAAPQAENPAPADGADDVPVTTDLAWTMGAGAVSQDVYFSKDASPAFKVTLPAGTTTYDPAGDLDLDTTYFWRIDSIDADSNTTVGEVWQFHTAAVLPPDETENPVPADGTVDVQQPITMTWDAIAEADSYDVYLGTNLADVTSATTADAAYKGSRATNSYDSDELDGGTMYFWRIDTVNDGGATASDVWRFTTAVEPGKATNPSPADVAVDIGLDTLLSWTAGADADTHEVYFGTDLNTVTNAVVPDDTTAATLYDPSAIMALTAETVYFWRIDEVAADGVTTTKGDVWRFETGTEEPGKATNPSPADVAVNVSLDTLLSWTAGADADTHEVYFGTDLNTVTNAVVPDDTTAATLYDPSAIMALTAETTYFWRIDEVAADGVTTTKGDVWRFETGTEEPGKATNPSPADVAVNVSLDTLLSWTAGTDADTHEVYFGTDLNTVANAAVPDDTTAITLYDPSAIMVLTADTTYFWRIDEVAADGVTTTKGDVWRFTTLAEPAQVGSPTPINNAVDQPLDTILEWAAANGATSYDVYVIEEAANSALPPADRIDDDTPGAAVFVGNQTARSYNPGALAANTTYLWRVDAVNDAGTTIGIVWEFTTVP